MSEEADILEQLRAEFPRGAISWRAQSVTKDGSKALALAYIDARDVRQRLNDVVGPANWTCEHYDCGQGRLACRLSIRIGDEWISKTDGAGETQVEAEKGAFSTALKRAGVAWGIGEYLYDLDAPWVTCETYEGKDGRKHWKRWKADPWASVKGSGVKPPSSADMKRKLAEIDQELLDCLTVADVNKCAKIWASIMERDSWPDDFQDAAKPKFAERRKALAEADDFPGDLPSNLANSHQRPLEKT